MRSIVQAVSSEQLRSVRLLFEEYAASLDFDLCFQGFDEELANLPGQYAPPDGCLLLGLYGRQPAGCVALRRISQQACEMKRLYVRPQFRGVGIGKAMCKAVVEEARRMGYARMLLDTAPSMVRARAIYESLGFVQIDPYRHNPLPGAAFMELRL